MSPRRPEGAGGESSSPGSASRRGRQGSSGGVRVRHVSYLAEGWGVGELWLDGERVLWHELPARGAHSPKEAASPPVFTLADAATRDSDASVPEVVRRLERYFAGEEVSFEGIDHDLEWCTPFQQAVAAALGAVRYGETVTYGELAALAGYPNAQRAVGTFCARNRLPLLLPCHRVVAAGGLGSYGSLGVEYKRRLLRLEGADAL